MEIFKNGSEWLKADFHLHTRKDKEFQYNGEDNSFITSYIDKLKDNNIGIGVITNHNKFDKDEFKVLYKKAKKESVYLLSGTELSINDGANGIHCLIVFDYDKWIINNDNFIEQFLNSAFEGIANRENENTRCNYNLADLFKKLEIHRKDGRDSFVVMAHVEQNNGFLKELEGGRIQQFVNDEHFKQNVSAFQKLRTADYKSKLIQWFGNEKELPAFVEGSDCKNLDEVGKAGIQKDENGEKVARECYLKIGDFNFEAIKYALLDKENRVRADNKPDIINSYIKSVHIESSQMGLLKDNSINFSPELNNFIGIRGSGKSAIIELIRYTLGISLSGQAVVDKEYKNTLIEYVLKSGGKISLTIVNEHKKEYRIEKIYGQKENIFEDGQRIEASVNGIFNVIYFGQKDLSNKDIDFESELISKLIGNRLEDVRNKISVKKEELVSAIENFKQLENLDEQQGEAKTKLANAEHKLNVFKEKGVEDKLKSQSSYDTDLRKLDEIKNTLSRLHKELLSVTTEYNSFFSDTLIKSAENEEIFKKAESVFLQVKKEYEAIQTAIKIIDDNNSQFNIIIRELEDKKESLKEDFARLKREIDIPNINPDEFLTVQRIIETSKLKLKEIEKLEKKNEEYRKKINDRLKELNDLWLVEHRIIEDEIKKIKSDTQLAIEIEFKGRKDKFLEKHKEVFRGSGISETNYKKISYEYPDFIEIYKDQTKLKSILNENQFYEYKRRLLENLQGLLTFQVGNRFTIKYNGKPLKDHSLGQRATALILFLLAQKDTDVLMIDQPEDDLDNETIYNDVIKEIKYLKGQMQFIFATHNANIPVLGDSEKIIACSYSEEKIDTLEGTIDNRDIQKRIVAIMEGGREAFKKRKNIYSLWKVEK